MIRDAESFGLLTQTIERFVRERLIPREQEVVDTDAIPEDILAEMRRMGLFGLTIPEEYGGLGLTMEEEVRVAFALCRASPAFRSIAGTNNGIGSLGIVFDGTEAQKRKYLPRLAAGELIGSFALTEPGSGSDAGSLTTSARREGDHYVLNGAKHHQRAAGRYLHGHGAHRPRVHDGGRRLGIHRRARHQRLERRSA